MNIGTGLANRKTKTCDHVSTIAITAAGIEREICEACGHVSFQFDEQQLENIDRNRFAREVDELTR